jgi:L-amino acid N-acyltransferase YncA
VGEAAYHYDPDEGIYLADVIIAAQCRRQGFGKAGLQMLCEHAKNEKIPELYDNIAIDNPGIHLFLQCGFQELIASSREKQQQVASKKVGGRCIIRGLLVFIC